jgi:intracellular sulfur oxidation DsrE/DsrF family protein
MWKKYGATFARMSRMPATEGEPAADKNPQTETITNMAAKGVQFAICNSATTMLSGLIAREAGLEAEAVHAELVANLIPNGHMVPAGVMALTRAQEYGYSFLYSAA